MAKLPNFKVIRSKIRFDYERLEESALVSFNTVARQEIHKIGVRAICGAQFLKAYLRPSAREAKSMARDIAKQATAAKGGLRSLLAVLTDSFSRGLQCSGDTWYEEDRMGLLQHAAHVLDGLIFDARETSVMRWPQGRPARQLLNQMTRALYGVYQKAGGKRRIAYSDKYKTYRGAPIFFLRAAVEQVKRFIPAQVAAQFFPATPSALTRAMVAAIRSTPTTGRKPPKKRTRKAK